MSGRRALIGLGLGLYLVGFGMLAGVAVERMRFDHKQRSFSIATKRRSEHAPSRCRSRGTSRRPEVTRGASREPAPRVRWLLRCRDAARRHCHDRHVLQHAALVGLGEHGFDGLHELSGRVRQLDGHARGRPEGLVDEIDVERVLEGGKSYGWS